MTADAARRSPLKADARWLGRASTETLTLAEAPFLTQLDIRADPSVPGLLEKIGQAVGVALPTTPNTVVGSASLAALWLGPDQWLVVASDPAARGLSQRLGRAVVADGATLVDVSAGRTTIELTGPRARRLLEAGCSLDLHPESFGIGACAQTLLGRVNVILWQLTDEPRYRLLVRPSFAHHLAVWLVDALEGLTGWT